MSYNNLDTHKFLRLMEKSLESVNDEMKKYLTDNIFITKEKYDVYKKQSNRIIRIIEKFDVDDIIDIGFYPFYELNGKYYPCLNP